MSTLNKLVVYTTYTSIAIQLLTGIVGVYGLTKEVGPEHQALKSALNIEMAVQLIEFAFYLWLVSAFHLPSMGATRYYDWILTTPLMLVSVMLYFKYEEYHEKALDTSTVEHDFWRDHKAAIAVALVGNLAMIVLGYLGEVGKMNLVVATVLGFAAFGVTFYTMYTRLASKSVVGTRLFAIMAVVWGLYGVVYVLPAAEKNIALNGLDVVAKNMFGLYLANKVIGISPKF